MKPTANIASRETDLSTSTLTLDIYDRTFDLEKVHPGTCLSVDDGDWFVSRTPDGWVDGQGTSWSSVELADWALDGGYVPRFKRLN
jgi:hypothetical protein|nr:MAG TPA: hypothetical protein [Caudoviricetes sp.]